MSHFKFYSAHLYCDVCHVLKDAIIDEFIEPFKGYYVYSYGRHNKVKIAEYCDQKS